MWGVVIAIGAGALGGWLAYCLATRVVLFRKPASVSASEEFSGFASWYAELYVCFAFPLFLMLVALGVVFVIAATSRGTSVKDEDHEWWSRCMAWLAIVALGWSIFSLLVLFGPKLLFEFSASLTTLGVLTGAVTLLLGRSAKTPAGAEGATAKPRLEIARGALRFEACRAALSRLLHRRAIVCVELDYQSGGFCN